MILYPGSAGDRRGESVLPPGWCEVSRHPGRRSPPGAAPPGALPPLPRGDQRDTGGQTAGEASHQSAPGLTQAASSASGLPAGEGERASSPAWREGRHRHREQLLQCGGRRPGYQPRVRSRRGPEDDQRV